MKSLYAIAVASLLALTACDTEGPAEEFGENVDESASELEEGAENLGDNIEDAGDELD